MIPKNVILAKNEALLAVDLDLGASVAAEHHPIALLHLKRTNGAVIEELALSDGENDPLPWLLLGTLGKEKPTPGSRRLLDPLHEDAVIEWTNLHETLLAAPASLLVA